MPARSLIFQNSTALYCKDGNYKINRCVRVVVEFNRKRQHISANLVRLFLPPSRIFAYERKARADSGNLVRPLPARNGDQYICEYSASHDLSTIRNLLPARPYGPPISAKLVSKDLARRGEPIPIKISHPDFWSRDISKFGG